MNNYKEVSKYMAEACDVHTYHNEGESDKLVPLWADDGRVCLWTIEDPRCREIIREKFGITTMESIEESMRIGWSAFVYFELKSPDKISTESYFGKTIVEAEIACIVAIYGSNKE